MKKQFFLYATNSRRRRNWILRNFFFGNQQETKLSEGYNLINGAKL